MKKIKGIKLKLGVETIRDLTTNEAKAAAGGWSLTCSGYPDGCGPSGWDCSQYMCTTTHQNCQTWTC